jgi:hypothetical protein
MEGRKVFQSDKGIRTKERLMAELHHVGMFAPMKVIVDKIKESIK